MEGDAEEEDGPDRYKDEGENMDNGTGNTDQETFPEENTDGEAEEGKDGEEDEEVVNKGEDKDDKGSVLESEEEGEDEENEEGEDGTKIGNGTTLMKKVKQTGTIEMEKMKTGREMMRMRIKLTRKVLTRMRGVGTKVRTWTMELETRTKATMT